MLNGFQKAIHCPPIRLLKVEYWNIGPIWLRLYVIRHIALLVCNFDLFMKFIVVNVIPYQESKIQWFLPSDMTVNETRRFLSTYNILVHSMMFFIHDIFGLPLCSHFFHAPQHYGLVCSVSLSCYISRIFEFSFFHIGDLQYFHSCYLDFATLKGCALDLNEFRIFIYEAVHV